MALEKLFGKVVDLARQITQGRSSAPPPPMDADEDPPVPRDDEVLLVPAGEGACLVSWQLTERGLARTQKLAAREGVVEARLYVVVRDAASGSRTTVRERTVGRAGEWLAAELPKGALVLASVGVLADGVFRSVAHSGPSKVA
jgi:hypothetical protein